MLELRHYDRLLHQQVGDKANRSGQAFGTLLQEFVDDRSDPLTVEYLRMVPADLPDRGTPSFAADPVQPGGSRKQQTKERKERAAAAAAAKAAAAASQGKGGQAGKGRISRERTTSLRNKT